MRPDDTDSERSYSIPRPWDQVMPGGFQSGQAGPSTSTSLPSTSPETERIASQDFDDLDLITESRPSTLHQVLRRREARHAADAEASTSRSPTRFGEARSAVADVWSRALRTGVSSIGTPRRGPRDTLEPETREPRAATSSRWGDFESGPTSTFDLSERRRRRLVREGMPVGALDAGSSTSIHRARMNGLLGRLHGEPDPDDPLLPRSYTSMEELRAAFEGRPDFATMASMLNQRRRNNTLGDFIVSWLCL